MKKLGILIFGIALILGIVVTNMFSFGRATGRMFHFNLDWKGVKGSGNVVSEQRDARDFHGIDVGGVYQVEVTAGKEYSVTVEADDNLVPLIRTEVEGGILKIESDRKISPKSTIRVMVSMPAIDSLEVSGVANVNVSGVKGDDLSVNSSGASKVSVSGQAEKLNVEVSGATRVDAGSLNVAQATVEASGASQVAVNVSQSLDAQASGASHVTYAGTPSQIKKDTSGAGSITQR
jgi:hypothetical protein